MKTKNLFKVLISILIFSICFVMPISGNSFEAINATTAKYAQIKNSNTYLYKSAELSFTNNKWCIIENSYFVKILQNYNAQFYKVEYNGIVGFVQKNEIQLVNEIPNTPYPNTIKFNIGKTSCYMRSNPKTKDVTDNTLKIIPANTKNLKFIGKIIGEEAIDFNGSIWYLTEYDGEVGYVYSGYTNSISSVLKNVEKVSNFTGSDFSKVNPLTNLQCIIIILLTLIPTLIILYLLYTPKKLKKIKTNPKNIDKNISNLELFDENL